MVKFCGVEVLWYRSDFEEILKSEMCLNAGRMTWSDAAEGMIAFESLWGCELSAEKKCEEKIVSNASPMMKFSPSKTLLCFSILSNRLSGDPTVDAFIELAVHCWKSN